MTSLLLVPGFGADPTRILRLVAIAVILYVFVHAVLRITGSRTLAQLTTFDIVVTVAMGAALGETIMNPDVELVEGAVAILVLVGLQWASDWITMKKPPLLRVITSPPYLLFFEGEYLENVMRKTRVTKEEIHEAMRREGYAHENEVRAVVLERNGEVTVVPREREEVDPRAEKSTLSEPAKVSEEKGQKES